MVSGVLDMLIASLPLPLRICHTPTITATKYKPKGPSRTKKTTESEFGTASAFGMALAKNYGECLEFPSFLN